MASNIHNQPISGYHRQRVAVIRRWFEGRQLPSILVEVDRFGNRSVDQEKLVQRDLELGIVQQVCKLQAEDWK